MLTRSIREDILTYLNHFPSLLITGARQVGKSTLAMDLGVDHYVTFDDISTFQAAKSDPKGFITSLKKPVVIDEIQKVPEVFVAIKEHIDKQRNPGTFILTGSSNMNGFKDISDSLAGRIGIIELYPFSLFELFKVNKNFIDQIFEGLNFNIDYPEIDLEQHILKGGFPDVQNMEEPKLRYLWFSSYIITYIERDARDIGNIRNLDGFMKLYKSLFLRSANLMNKADLSKETGLNNKTLENYLGVLKNTYQISLLKPYLNNELKRMVKTPKVFILDTGILSHLLRITSPTRLKESEYKGMLYESFVYSELIKSNAYAAEKVEFSYYRTSDGKEIDFILDNGEKIIAIEVKSAKSVKSADFKHIKSLSDELGCKIDKGIVLYNGSKQLSFGEQNGVPLFALPLSILAN